MNASIEGTLRSMDQLFAIARDRGVFLTCEVKALGYDDHAIARAVRSGLWHRVRRGAYVPGPTWLAADPVERHLLRAAAVHRSYGDRVAFSHVTAALLHGIDVWGLDLRRVHVTRLDGGAGRTERDIVHHEAWCLEKSDVVQHQGRIVVTPARAALETGLLGTTEQGLVVLDSTLHQGLATPTEIGDVFDAIAHWPRSQHLHIAVRMADKRPESVGESRTRWLCFCEGLPAPTLQHEVRDPSGLLIGTTDFAWLRHRTLGEFDGKVKYGRLLKKGQSASDVLFAEKRREDDIRRTTHCGMVRVVWIDLDRPATTARWIRRYLDDAA